MKWFAKQELTEKGDSRTLRSPSLMYGSSEPSVSAT